TKGFNGAISNLPAFQGLMSYFLPLTDPDTGDLTQGDNIFLGSLSPLRNLVVTPTASDITVTYGSVEGLPQEPTDIVYMLAFRASPRISPEEYNVKPIVSATRADGSIVLPSSFNSGESIQVWIWAESSQVGIPSDQKFSEVRLATTTIP